MTIVHEQTAATGLGLSTSGLRKTFGGVVALDDVSFQAEPGEVHALLGENGAGKSTFIRLLAGATKQDRGEIRLFGEPIRRHSIHQAQRLGIATVFQELPLVPDLDVAQNIWFHREPRAPWGTISRRRLYHRTQGLLQELGLQYLELQREVKDLSLSERQLVAIARALAVKPRVLILDEATSALSAHEVEWLLSLCRTLAAAGTTVLFISHRLSEVRQVADRVTIFRNGRNVGSHRMTDVSDNQILVEMLGRSPMRLYPPKEPARTPNPVLRVRDLRSGRRLQGIDFDLVEGEILGVGGLQGQGQMELLLSLCGLNPSKGTIEIGGKRCHIRNPAQALHAGVGLVILPEDRQTQGLLVPKSIRDNVTLPVLDRVSRFGMIDRRREETLARGIVERVRLVYHEMSQPVRSLSGGNQQKVVMARLLLTRARILLLADPVRGVDVGAKAEIFRLMRELVQQGYSCVFYSTDVQELVNVADRALVLLEGRIAATLEGDDLTEDNVLRAAVGGASTS